MTDARSVPLSLGHPHAMSRLPHTLLVGLLTLALASACGDDASGDAPSTTANATQADAAGEDTADDVGVDAARDAASDAAHDVLEDATPDAAPDVFDDVPNDDATPDVLPDTPDPDMPLPDQLTGIGPTTRMTSIDSPFSPAEGRQLGCQVLGPSVGSGISNILLLSGGLTQYMRPNSDGVIPLHALAAIDGWEPGQLATAIADPVTLTFYYGRFDDQGRTLPHPDTFTDGDPALPPRFRFPDSLVTPNGWLETSPGPFTLTTPVFGDLLIDINLHHTVLQGQLLVDGPGFAMPAGVVTGYLLRQDLLDVLIAFQDACASDAPPALCNVVGDIFAPDVPPEQLLDDAQGFIGGFDVHVPDEGARNPFPCQPTRDLVCNAVSVCLTFTSEGVALHPD